MDAAKLRDYLDNDLKNEIRYLLAAATEWHAQDKMNLEIPGYEVQVYAMDSTFLTHALSLSSLRGRRQTTLTDTTLTGSSPRFDLVCTKGIGAVHYTHD